MGITEQTFYRWKKRYGGLGANELRHLRQLEEENRKLRQMVADSSLDKHMLQEAIPKKLRGLRRCAPWWFFSRMASG
jgi:putative transposase